MEVTLRDGISVRHGERIPYMGLMVETKPRALCATWYEEKRIYHVNFNGIEELPSGPAANMLRMASEKLEPMILDYLTTPTHDKWWSIKQAIAGINAG